MRPERAFGLWLAASTLAACTVGPDYKAPAPAEVDMPAAWHAAQRHALQPQAPPAGWWSSFNDPVLMRLVETAQSNSPTLDAAQARVREARAELDANRGALFPSFTANASATRSNGVAGAIAVQTLSQGTLDAMWLIDLFGRTRRGIEGSAARLEATEDASIDARGALAASVAGTYAQRRQCELIDAQNQVDLASRKETHRLTRDKVNAGFGAPADLYRTEASVAEATTVVIGTQAQCGELVNLLAVLTGMPHAEIEGLLASGTTALVPVPPETPIPAIPAQALAQRPDVAAAERALAAANADIGVAVADRFPAISLSGSIGTARYTLAGATTRPNTWSIGPAVSLPIFDAGILAARVEAARARREQALAAYRDKVRTAVQEVEDGLVRTDAALERERSAALADARYQQFFAAKEAQYRLGAASLLELEDARRLTVIARLSLANVQLERVQSWISLYRAVGGGWTQAASQERQ